MCVCVCVCVCMYIYRYSLNKYYYYPYRAFGGQNKIVYSMRFVTRRAIISLLPGLYVTYHLILIYVYD